MENPSAFRVTALLKQVASVRRLIERITDTAQRQDLLELLDDPAYSQDKRLLDDLQAAVVGLLRDSEEPTGDTIFESQTAALEYLHREVFPKVSANFRLFKTAKLKQDEYIVVNRDLLHGLDTYQTYANDRDVNDQLVSMGLPTSVFHMPHGGKKPVKLSVLSAWRKQRATQEGKLNTLEYIPGGADIVGHAFNTFKDVSVEPVEGIDVTIFLDHVRDNLCNGNVAYYEYLMKWLAHLVQRPWERPLTGLSIIGGQGTGKGIFIDLIARMLGGRRNANTTTSAKDNDRA